ncbi:hypothetical protein KUCAC02_000606, partial [Chaenocephalus aceratus]
GEEERNKEVVEKKVEILQRESQQTAAASVSHPVHFTPSGTTETRDGATLDTLASTKSPLRAALPDSQTLAPPTPVERILKRFGAQPLCCSLSFFSPPPSDPPPSPSRLLPFSAEGSFKGLGKALERQSQFDPGVVEPRGELRRDHWLTRAERTGKKEALNTVFSMSLPLHSLLISPPPISLTPPQTSLRLHAMDVNGYNSQFNACRGGCVCAVGTSTPCPPFPFEAQ